MELNDIPLKYEDVQTAKQQSLAITHCYFKQPMKQFLQQLNIQDSNAQLWLAEFAWHDTSSAHYRSAYHILDMVFCLVRKLTNISSTSISNNCSP